MCSKLHLDRQSLDAGDCDASASLRPSLDDGVADHQRVHPGHQEPQESETRRVTDPDSRRRRDWAVVFALNSPEQEPLEDRSVPDGDRRHGGGAHMDAPQAAAPDADGHGAPAPEDDELLQDGAPLKKEGEFPLVDRDGDEVEFTEGGEHGGGREGEDVREAPEADVEAREGGAREDGAGEGDEGLEVRRVGCRAVGEDEVLDVLDGEELEQARDLGGVRGHGGAGEVDAAEGARVRGEGAGHGGGGEGVGVGVGEDERRRGPDATPAPGERGGARGVLGGEARDDVA